jgi:hypothetical protein
MKQTRINPHKERRSSIHFTFFLLALFIAIVACSCRVQYGCPTRIHKKKFTAFVKRHMAWIKCNETGLVCLLSPDGEIVYAYYEPKNK